MLWSMETVIKKQCPICNNYFSVKLTNKKQKFCSKKCRLEYFSKIYKGKGNPFYGKAHSKKYDGMKGKNHSKESKLKMSKSRKGKKFSEQHRRSLSLSRKKYLFDMGKTSRKWKEQIRRSIDYKLWREAVFKRDDFTCQKCNARNGNGKEVYLEAHHIKSFIKYPKLRYEVTNGLTLCKDCHKKENKRQMKGNKNGVKKLVK